jgi:hypothetical protein
MRSLLIPSVFLLLGSSLFAQSAPTLDVKSMLQGLQQIKQQQATSAKTQLTQTIADFSAAAADDGAAENFYVEAVRVTRFVGQQGEATAFSDWEKGALPRLNPAAIHLALRYTTISLQRAAGATDEQIFPVLFAYAMEAQDALPGITATQNAQQTQQGQQEGNRRGFGRQQGGPREEEPRILEEPVSDNIFSKWYNLGGQLGALDNWEQVPGNIDSIFQQTLLPMMRKLRDPRIIQYWDNKIVTERANASGASAAFSTDRFNQTRRPTLLWSRAEDEVAIGQREQGLNDMYSLVKTFPSHPDAGKWIKELQDLLTTSTAPAASTAPR